MKESTEKKEIKINIRIQVIKDEKPITFTNAILISESETEIKFLDTKTNKQQTYSKLYPYHYEIVGGI